MPFFSSMAAAWGRRLQFLDAWREEANWQGDVRASVFTYERALAGKMNAISGYRPCSCDYFKRRRRVAARLIDGAHHYARKEAMHGGSPLLAC